MGKRKAELGLEVGSELEGNRTEMHSTETLVIPQPGSILVGLTDGGGPNHPSHHHSCTRGRQGRTRDQPVLGVAQKCQVYSLVDRTSGGQYSTSRGRHVNW